MRFWLIAMMLLAPTAQAWSLDVSDVPGPVATDIPHPMRLMMTMDCEDARFYSDPVNQTVLVNLETESPKAMMHNLPAGTLVDASDCYGTADEATAEVAFEASLVRGTLAFDPQPVTITAEAVPRQSMGAALETISTTFEMRAAYEPLLEMKAPTVIKQVAPGEEVAFALELTNFGNGQSRIEFALREPPEWNGAPQALVPVPVLLDENAGQRPVAVADMIVMAGSERGEFAFVVTAQPEYTFDAGLKGEPVEMTLLVRVQGIGGLDTPNATPALSGLALLGAALLARRISP